MSQFPPNQPPQQPYYQGQPPYPPQQPYLPPVKPKKPFYKRVWFVILAGLASIFHWWSDDGRTVGCPLVCC